jgi:hypothetical protein
MLLTMLQQLFETLSRRQRLFLSVYEVDDETEQIFDLGKGLVG